MAFGATRSRLEFTPVVLDEENYAFSLIGTRSGKRSDSRVSCLASDLSPQRRRDNDIRYQWSEDNKCKRSIDVSRK